MRISLQQAIDMIVNMPKDSKNLVFKCKASDAKAIRDLTVFTPLPVIHEDDRYARYKQYEEGPNGLFVVVSNTSRLNYEFRFVDNLHNRKYYTIVYTKLISCKE